MARSAIHKEMIDLPLDRKAGEEQHKRLLMPTNIRDGGGMLEKEIATTPYYSLRKVCHELKAWQLLILGSIMKSGVTLAAYELEDFHYKGEQLQAFKNQRTMEQGDEDGRAKPRKPSAPRMCIQATSSTEVGQAWHEPRFDPKDNLKLMT